MKNIIFIIIGLIYYFYSNWLITDLKEWHWMSWLMLFIPTFWWVVVWPILIFKWLYNIVFNFFENKHQNNFKLKYIKKIIPIILFILYIIYFWFFVIQTKNLYFYIIIFVLIMFWIIDIFNIKNKVKKEIISEKEKNIENNNKEIKDEQKIYEI